MALLTWGVVLVVVGLLLALSNLFGFEEAGAALVWIGWVLVAAGLVMATLDFARRRRTGTVEAGRRRVL